MARDDASNNHDDFQRQAERFGLRLKRKSFVAGEHQDLGMFMAAETSGPQSKGYVSKGKTDDELIGETIHRLETTHPDDAEGLFDDTVTEPVHLFTTDGMVAISRSNLADIKASPENQKNESEAPVKNPREVEISGLKTTHLGKSRASATYCAEEECANGEVLRHNVAAFLTKTKKGWRVQAVSHKQR